MQVGHVLRFPQRNGRQAERNNVEEKERNKSVINRQERSKGKGEGKQRRQGGGRQAGTLTAVVWKHFAANHNVLLHRRIKLLDSSAKLRLGCAGSVVLLQENGKGRSKRRVRWCPVLGCACSPVTTLFINNVIPILAAPMAEN